MIHQPSLFDQPPNYKPARRFGPQCFGGITYESIYDYERLVTLLGRVFRFMADQRWHTIQEVQQACGGTESSVSARFRDLRKAVFGGFTVDRQPRGDRSRGLFEYRLIFQVEADRGAA